MQCECVPKGYIHYSLSIQRFGPSKSASTFECGIYGIQPSEDQEARVYSKDYITTPETHCSITQGKASAAEDRSDRFRVGSGDFMVSPSFLLCSSFRGVC